MECRHGNFWIGLGIGSILGAVAYRLSRTAKARQLESDIYNAIHRIGRDAEIAAAEAERKAMNLGFHFSFILIAFFLKIYLNQILSLSLISAYA